MKTNKNTNAGEFGKILLVLLPFWDPEIPPSGISYLKSFLQQHGYTVKTVDANMEEELKEVYHRYFETLKENIPLEKRGNFYKIAHTVLRNHLMAHLHYTEQGDYLDVVKSVIFKTFFCEVDENRVHLLTGFVRRYFDHLETYFLHLLETEKPALLGLSVYEDTLPSSLFAFKITREKYPHIKTVMGGGVFTDFLAPGSPDLARLLERTESTIDNVFIGEGENLFLEYLTGKLPQSQRVYTLEDINGKNLDLSTVEIADFSDFDLRHYPYLAAYASRSCPYQCSFCSETTQWGKYRKKDAQQVVDELMLLYEKYRYQSFLMSDSLLNPIITDLAHAMIAAGKVVYWDGYLRIDEKTRDPETTLLWRRGGFYRARLGVESGSPRVLELMDKKITPGQIRRGLSGLAHAGVKTTTYWVVGYPGETEEDFRQTLALIEEQRDNIYEADCTPFHYFPTARMGMDREKDESLPLYTEKAAELLIIQKRYLDGEPSREEIYRRMWRFTEHCHRIGVPNPYSINDVYKADERWKKLHKNAVPSLTEFNDPDIYIDEAVNVGRLITAANILEDDNGFDF